jgi:hypothetical protein
MRKDQVTTAQDHEALVDAIRPILAGQDHAIQSTVLAELLAIWIVGHRPDLREDLFRKHISLVRKLMPVVDKEAYGDAGFPSKWQ